MAYAIGGQIKGARWFADSRIFNSFAPTLANPAAMDAINAQAGRPPEPPPEMKPDSVTRFVSDIEKAAQEERRDTAGANENHYKKSRRGYRSKTRLRGGKGEAADISYDYLAD
jgi:hypothetical protein